MFAIVEIAGQQFKVSPSAKLFVPKIANQVGNKLKFDKVLLFSDDNGIKVGSPILKGMKVEAEILNHLKDDTVIVFKKKKRKGYRVRKGHRQQYTHIQITNIGKEN